MVSGVAPNEASDRLIIFQVRLKYLIGFSLIFEIFMWNESVNVPPNVIGYSSFDTQK